MILKFLNGTEVQKQVVRQALDDLLHLPLDFVGLGIWEVAFVSDPDEGESHNEFALTLWEYDSGKALTKLRSDFPHFPQPWSGLGFARETAIHEFGHALYANLPPGARERIAQMFGAKDDSAINDPSKPWGERVVEGIAETFKDAFLPQRFRRYSNRTARRIPISQYPEFRQLVRGRTGAGGFNYVYGSSAFRVDLSKWGLTGLPFHESEHDDEAFVFYEEIKGFEQCWGVDMSQFTESGHMPFSIEPSEGGAS